MEFGIEKCAMLIMKSKKRQMTEGIEQKSQEKIRMLKEKETQIIGIIRSGHHLISENEKKKLKTVSQGNAKLLETKLHSRIIIKMINTWAVPLDHS